MCHHQSLTAGPAALAPAAVLTRALLHLLWQCACCRWFCGGRGRGDVWGGDANGLDIRHRLRVDGPAQPHAPCAGGGASSPGSKLAHLPVDCTLRFVPHCTSR